jgi:hypothetical protein
MPMRKSIHANAARLSIATLGAALVVALMATPALAAMPTISSFAPATGVIGTPVTITGTGFNDAPSPVSSVKFNGVTATFTVNSDTQITATVPAGATTGAITVTDSEGTATSATNFTVTPSPVPTITSFAPASGNVGTSVVITGTGFFGTSAVKFNNLAATTFTVDSDTQITAIVPTGATTGPITVTTPGGSATSSTNFTVTVPVTRHTRSITLELRKHLVARGRVTVAGGFAACQAGATVKIQRWRNGAWRTIETDVTGSTGRYREHLADRVGKYRAVVKKRILNNGADVCRADTSPVRRHTHA